MDINFLDRILPTQIWAISTGLSLILVMLACGLYLYFQKRFRSAIKDYEDVADLAAKKVQLEAEIEQCRKWLDENRERLLESDAKIIELNKLEQELANLGEKAAQKQQEVDDLRKETYDLQNVVTVLSQDRERLNEDIKVLNEKMKSLEKENAEFEKANRDMHGIIERYEEEKKKFDRLLQDMAQHEIKQQSLIGEISSREAQLTQVQNELKQAQENLSKIKADIVPLEEIIKEKERIRKDRNELLEEIHKHKEAKDNIQKETDELERKKDNLRHEVDVLNKKIIELKTDAGKDIDERDRYADLYTQPDCLNEKKYFPQGKLDAIEEYKKIQELMESLKNKGFIFSERTIKAFHTSLKISSISPLTVLAGISGTGKTLLPIKYAEAMGMHHLVVSIQPRWDSPQDLFGFYNYLEHKYKATDMARALIRMDRYHFKQLEGGKKSDRMLLVLLDEMNLARVEYYFSEFLSKLELRRDVDESNAAQRSRAEIELETGPRSDKDMTFRLWVGENVLFVGTINEDESTQTLSDKVLDRANVLRFGKPTDGVKRGNNDRANLQEKYLPFSEWGKWIKPLSGNNDWDRDVDKWIKGLNNALEHIGRPFGHRVQQSIRLYVTNYPGVNDGNTHRYAFADQVEQKIIPKLRGIDLNENSSIMCLDEIYNLVTELGDGALEDSFSKSKDDQSTGTFIWRGVTRD